MSRLKYLVIVLAVFVVLGGVYFLFFRQEEKKPPEALLVSEPTILWIDGRTLSVIFDVKNPNKNYGANNYSYRINLFDDHNNIVKSIQKSLFIYENETETLAETKIDTGGNIVGRAEVIITETNWVSGDDFSEPAFKIESLETIKESNFYAVKAKIYNSNNFDISKIVFCAVLYTKAGQELAAVRLDSDSMKAKKNKGLIGYVNIDSSMEQYLDMSATKFYVYVKK